MPDAPPPPTPPTPPAIAPRPRAEPAYAELSVRTNYDFLTGASHPEELVDRAAALGLAALAVTDTHTLGGVVRAHVAARQAGLPLVVGSRVLLRPPEPGPPVGVLLYPTDRDSYGRLCRLLTIGKRRADKGDCVLTAHDLLELHAGLLAVVRPPATPDDSALRTMAGLRSAFDDDRLSVAVARRLGPDDDERFWQARALAQRLGVPLAAVNDVLHHAPERRPLQDVLTCVRHGCTLTDAGLRLQPNGERHLKSPAEMARLMPDCPQALARSVQIARRAGAFSLDCLRYEYPDEVVPPGATPMSHLAELTWAGARERYPRGVPEKVRAQILHELALIDELRYAPYFLTVHDVVRFARGRRILCQGRGAAANSAVCYCLGVTSVDPDRISLLFERFISRERNEPPDIDIDFEHERREEVLQYIYGKYGRDRAALTAEIICYRGRSAVREIGKALGLSLDCTDRLARNLELWSDGAVPPERLAEVGLDPADPTVRRLAALCRQASGFPRHRSQHVGGFVISRGPLCETVPIENAAMPDRTVIEWDKDDLDAMGLLKIDCLGLGMLTCIRKTMESVNAAPGPPRPPLELHTIPPEDAGVYDMICRADTVGVFQIESRAQMSMLPRLRPRCFYDLVIEVAIVRPGPIQGRMVHPYLRRRNGQEPEWYPDERVRAVLGRTLGVPLFQEQAMALAIVAAGFTPGEADALRRAMAAWKRKGDLIARFGRKIIDGMTARGYSPEFAERCFEQIKGFSEYGFPESHAASFALLVYASCWLKHHHPAAFAGALLNSQPMGFYAPAQIVRDAQEHGVEVRPIDVNASGWDCTLEHPPGGGPPALRLGLRLVDGLGRADAEAVCAAVAAGGPIATIDRLRRRSAVGVGALRRLAEADAFGSMGLDRQRALWHILRLRDEPLPLFDDAPAAGNDRDGDDALPAVPAPRRIAHDYAATGLSLKGHPLAEHRPRLAAMGVRTADALRDKRRWPHGRAGAVAGLVLLRQRPATASGVVFMTIEDETAAANLILFPKVYRRFRRAARHGAAVLARGTVERQGAVVHLIVRRVEDLRDVLGRPAIAAPPSRDFH